MATPPFTLDTTHPGDTDIVSQFPANERNNNRDVINSWLLVDHNNNPGGHNKLTMPNLADQAAPSASTAVYWSDTTWGYLKTRAPNNIAGSVVEVLLPPGITVPFAGSTAPSGWALANGQALSRTTFSRLFSFIGTTFGAGDGVNTFNVPDLRGRIVAGDDTMGASAAGRLTNATSGFSASATIGQSGGSQTVTLATANLPPYTPAGTVSAPAISNNVSGTSVYTPTGSVTIGGNSTGNNSVNPGSVPAWMGTDGVGGGLSQGISSTSATFTGNAVSFSASAPGFTGTAQGGSSTPVNQVQPTLIMNWIIKT